MEKLTVWCYSYNVFGTDNLNKLGFDEAWLVLKKEWVEEQVKQQDFDSLDQFLSECTFDDTEGWYDKAMEDGALLGFGMGEMNDDTIWRLTKEDFQSLLDERGIELSFDEKHKFFEIAKSCFNIEDWSEWVSAFINVHNPNKEALTDFELLGLLSDKSYSINIDFTKNTSMREKLAELAKSIGYKWNYKELVWVKQ